jgi:Phosphotransferase enzyme family
MAALAEPMVSAGVMNAGDAARLAARPADPDFLGAIISHRDTGPWNTVARDGLPVAFIDWVTAGPADLLDEIAATAWLNEHDQGGS